MPKIIVYRNWTTWENDTDDEPTVVRSETSEHLCDLDDVDRGEGLTVADLAVAVLEGKLYVTETSNYPWQPGSWYAATPGPDFSYGRGGEEEQLTAHLEGFTPDEERAVFESLRKHVSSIN